MTNTKLLEYANLQGVLTQIERQRLYCLKKALAPNPCPVCRTMLNLVEASGLSLDDYPVDHGAKEHRCPSCKAPLEQSIPFLPCGNGGWYWSVADFWAKEQRQEAQEA